METNKLTDRLCVRGQIMPGDVAAAKAAGFRAIICNRPDGEAPGQPASDAIRAAAEACGLDFTYNPVSPGAITTDAVERQGAALQGAGGKVLAYCGSGKRATVLWALANPEGLSAEERLECASGAGYDLGELRAAL